MWRGSVSWAVVCLGWAAGVVSWRARPSPRSCRSPPWCRSGWSTMVILWLPLRLRVGRPVLGAAGDVARARRAVVRPPRAGRRADAVARCTATRPSRARHHRSGVDLAGGPQRPAAGRFRGADPAVVGAQRVRLRRAPRRRDVVRGRWPDPAAARRRARPRAEPPPRHAHRGADARPLVVDPSGALRPLRVLPAERRPRRDRQLRRPLGRPDGRRPPGRGAADRGFVGVPRRAVRVGRARQPRRPLVGVRGRSPCRAHGLRTSARRSVAAGDLPRRRHPHDRVAGPSRCVTSAGSDASRPHRGDPAPPSGSRHRVGAIGLDVDVVTISVIDAMSATTASVRAIRSAVRTSTSTPRLPPLT